MAKIILELSPHTLFIRSTVKWDVLYNGYRPMSCLDIERPSRLRLRLMNRLYKSNLAIGKRWT